MNKKTEAKLKERSGNSCEICGSTDKVAPFMVDGLDPETEEGYAMICGECLNGAENTEKLEGNAWRALNESMWSEVDAVKVLSYRLLQKVYESWANDALEMMYMEEDLLKIADSVNANPTHFDANGNPLYKGDSVTLIKDLDVKGSSLVAKRGTAVRNISLAHDDPSHIVGKVDGQTIYIKTEFVKK